MERRIFVAAEAGVGSCVRREVCSDIGEVEVLLEPERRPDADFLILGIQESIGGRERDRVCGKWWGEVKIRKKTNSLYYNNGGNVSNLIRISLV